MSSLSLSFCIFHTYSRQKANKVVNQVSSSLPEGAKNFIQNAKERVFDSDKLRSFSVFFGIGEQRSFNIVLRPTNLLPRLKNNVLFFYLNYIILTFLVFLLSLLVFVLNPTTMIILAVLAVAWFVALKATTSDGFQVCGFTVTRKEVSALMIIISGVVAYFTFESVFWASLGSSSFLALLHAWLRDAAEHQMDNMITAENMSMSGNYDVGSEADVEIQ